MDREKIENGQSIFGSDRQVKEGQSSMIIGVSERLTEIFEDEEEECEVPEDFGHPSNEYESWLG